MTVATELSEILAMRTSSAYQAAERIRQSIGAERMATYPPASNEYAGLRLMVGTWETIAVKVRGDDALKIPFYQNNPVNYMWVQLLPGIKAVRKEFKRKSAGAQYAANFAKLNRAYMSWLKHQPAAYQTAALEGINAQFG